MSDDGGTVYTWRLGLSRLDGAEAVFTNPSGDVYQSAEMTIPLDPWIKMGRPGMIAVTPEAVS